MSVTTGTLDALRVRPREALTTIARRNSWALGLLAFFAGLLILTNVIQPGYGALGVQRLAVSVLPLVMAAVAQAVVVIAGGIDLSIASIMALTSVVSAELMKGQSEEFAVLVVIGVILLGMLLGAINGTLVVLTRVPDIVVTLATFFVWSGFALLVRPSPGGGAATWLKDLMTGSVGIERCPEGGPGDPDPRRRDLDPHQALERGPVDLRHRQQPAGRVPERRGRRPDEGHVVRRSADCSPRLVD